MSLIQILLIWKLRNDWQQIKNYSLLQSCLIKQNDKVADIYKNKCKYQSLY